MDDCNLIIECHLQDGSFVQIPLWTIVTLSRRIPGRELHQVQIPLWTIVTKDRILKYILIARSDSSMDDCNK